ncbi:hypothetical protein BT63DRAFT_146298 [Microthyrium microscopicum]|uniref:DUF6604 domain-containing protein n=1 Tax=Microthyrium microscopicum TaxID=703497 RepID=A0A6A6UNR2_9PEZI|nr:hypothetical protein BT63DRAFT_146298 [Microthyrium microscopicum]
MTDSLYKNYCQYKADTDIFTSWLLETAASCGMLIENSAEYGSTQTYDLSCVEYLQLAQVIAGAKVQLPLSIGASVSRAIVLREKCAAEFRNNCPDLASIEGHDHFITVLQNALECLKSTKVSDNANRRSQNIRASQGASAKPVVNDNSLSNRFAAISIKKDDSKAVETECTAKTTKPTVQGVQATISKPQSAEKSDATPNSRMFLDQLFAGFGLLVELNKLRQFIADTWCAYASGSIDSMTAGVTSNSALAEGRELINAFDAVGHPLFSNGKSVSKLFFGLISKQRGQEPWDDTKPFPSFSENVYDVATWTFFSTNGMLRQLLCDFPKTSRKIPTFEVRDAVELRSTKPCKQDASPERYREDQELLHDVVHGLRLANMFKVFPPVKSQIEENLVDMLDTHNVNTLHAFNAQVLLDVRTILSGERHNPFNDWRLAALMSKKNLTKLFEFTSKKSSPYWTKTEEDWAQVCHRETQQYIDDAKMWFPQPGFGQKLSFHYQVNPIAAGLAAYHLSCTMQKVGILVLNRWITVIPTIYLYSILKTMNMPHTPDWPDLDQFLKLHDENSIFIGGRPSNVQDSYKKLRLFFGLSLVYMKNKARSGVRLRSKNGQRQVHCTTPLAISFMNAFQTGCGTPYSLGTVKKIIQCNDSIESLTLLQNAMACEEPKVIFNYIGLSIRSFEFSEQLHRHMEDRLINAGLPSNLTGEYAVLTISRHILNKVVETLEDGRQPYFLEKVASLMADYAKRNGSIACNELRTFSKKMKLDNFKTA